MSEPDLREVVRSLEGRVRALEMSAEATSRQIRDEHRHEFKQTLAGAQKTLETAIHATLQDISPKLERLDSVYPKLDELFQMNEEQRDLLRESKEERLERKLREKVALEAKQESDRRKAEREAEAQAQYLAMRERREHFIKICAAIATVLAPIAAILATFLARK